MQMLLVTCFGVMFSTFLSGPIALLATVSGVVMGLSGQFIRNVATGVEQGGNERVVDSVAVPEAIGLTARPRAMPTKAPATRAGLSVVPDPEPGADEEKERLEAERKRAEAGVQQAVAAADEARRKVRKAAKRVTKVQARTLQAAEELEEAKSRVAELEHELETLDEEAVAADERKERAEERYTEAQEGLEQAQAALNRVG